MFDWCIADPQARKDLFAVFNAWAKRNFGLVAPVKNLWTPKFAKINGGLGGN